MIDTRDGRTWRNAPSGVRDARIIIVLNMIYEVLVLAMAAGGLLRNAPLGSPLVCALLAVIFAVQVWLLMSLRRGKPGAWEVTLVLSVLGLLAFPVGTLINIILLVKWFKPETKAWFAV